MRGLTTSIATMGLVLGLAAFPESAAQDRQESSDPCASMGWANERDSFRHCEVRETTLGASPLTVDAGRNGGIRVEGWDRGDVLVRAVVIAQADSEARARELAAAVQIDTSGQRVQATGPVRMDDEWWSVSFRLQVPRRSDLQLTASNGGVRITGVHGDLRFTTRNGGVRLHEVGGTVRGRTTNGGVQVSLGGERWDGTGLDVETTNGGVTLALPAGYNAQVQTATVNGSIRSEHDMTVQGDLTSRRRLDATLGSGGPLLRLTTKNGGVRLTRR